MTFWIRENVYGGVFRHVRHFSGLLLDFSSEFHKKTSVENFFSSFYRISPQPASPGLGSGTTRSITEWAVTRYYCRPLTLPVGFSQILQFFFCSRKFLRDLSFLHQLGTPVPRRGLLLLKAPWKGLFEGSIHNCYKLFCANFLLNFLQENNFFTGFCLLFPIISSSKIPRGRRLVPLAASVIGL